MKKLQILSIAIVALMCVQVSNASVFVVPGDGDDQQVNADGSTNWVGQPEIRVGVGGTQGSNAVLVFELPVLPAGEVVVDAIFDVTIVGINSWNALVDKTADLYGLPLRSGSAVQGTDFFHGSYGTDTGATALQESIFAGDYTGGAGQNNFVGDTTITTDATGSANLTAYLNAQYASASYDPAGTNYVFLRLSTEDWAPTTYRYWIVASANNSTEANRPVLTITSDIPEPASLSLLAIVGLAIARRR